MREEGRRKSGYYEREEIIEGKIEERIQRKWREQEEKNRREDSDEPLTVPGKSLGGSPGGRMTLLGRVSSWRGG